MQSVTGMLWHLIIHLVRVFDWEEAPWFDATGLNDVAPMQKETVVQKLQNNNGSLGCCYYGWNTSHNSDLVHLLYT